MKKSIWIIALSLIIIIVIIFFIAMAMQGFSPIELLIDLLDILIYCLPVLIPIALNIYFIIKIFLTVWKNKNKPIKWLVILSIICFAVYIIRLIASWITPNLDMSGVVIIPILFIISGIFYFVYFISSKAINSVGWNIALGVLALVLFWFSIAPESFLTGFYWFFERFFEIIKP